MGRIKLYIMMGGNGQTIMGKCDLTQAHLDYDLLDDVIQVDLAQDKSGAIVPVDVTYPHPFIHVFLTKKAVESENSFKIYRKDCSGVYDESEIRQEMIDWYQRVLAQKSGIEVVQKSNIIS